MKQNPISRRAFLQGLGGTALAIPFLTSLVPSNALAQASTPPMRFVFMGARFGRHYASWYPDESAVKMAKSLDGVYSARLSDIQGPMSAILGTAFDPIRNKMSLIRGLDGMQKDADGHSPGIATTGSGYGVAGLGFPYSIDCILEESIKFYAQPAFASSIRTSPAPKSYTDLSFSYSSRSGALQRKVPIKDAMDLYNKYFNPANLKNKENLGARQKMITNLVMDDYKSVMNSRRIASADKYIMENYMTLMSEAEKTLGLASLSCNAATMPDATITNSQVLHEVMMNLEIAALACGLTKIVTHSIYHNTSEMIPNDGESHSSAHNGISSSSESGRAPVPQATLNNWTLARVAEFIKRLDGVQESNGTLLDNTIFYHSNVEATGYHSFTDMPVILAGAGNKLNLGLYIDYRSRPLSTTSRIAPGRPINNLLVTIMKALGLQEADYEKFGRKGFGVYDYDVSLAAHYAPFLGANVNNTLPLLYRG